MLVNAQQTENGTRRLKCANEYATAFFISGNRLLTAYHAVMDSEPGAADVFLYEPDGTESVCSIVKVFPESDLCILETEASANQFLPLQSMVIKAGLRSHIFGYPYKSDSSNLTLTGRVNRIQREDRADFLIGELGIDNNFDYEGFSGSAVIINGYVGGIILRQNDQQLAAISIEKVSEILRNEGFTVEEEYDFQQVPEEFHDAVRTSAPNHAVFQKIDQAVKGAGSWTILKGTPGSGKSTIVAGYNPTEKGTVICGKYFVKVPDDKSPVTLRTSPEFFLEWIEDLVSRTVSGVPHARPEGTFEHRSSLVMQYFEELNSHYQQRDEIGIIMIDGLDEIDDLKRFLSILPGYSPTNLRIILSHANATLPPRIQSFIAEEQTIVVTPLAADQCEAFIAGQIGRNVLTPFNFQQLAHKSEGHPLYLRYLVNYINQNSPSVTEEELEAWLDEIPAIQGDIVNYYNAIWESIYQVPEKLWILIVLSRLRQPVKKEDLYEILPDNVKMAFSSYLPAIHYLLNGYDRLEVYHNSFKEYISGKTTEQTRLAHDQISGFCKAYPDKSLSVNNILYHLLGSSIPAEGVSSCTQLWADRCVRQHVEPDLVILDIKQVIQKAVILNRAPDIIRLLLLLERITFRYNKVFSENAVQLAEMLIAMKQYDSAIRYLVRNGILQVSGSEATTFLRLLYDHEAVTQATLLEDAIHAAFRLQYQEAIASGEGISFELFRMELLALSLSMNADFEGGKARFYRLLGVLRAMRADAEEDGASDAVDDINDFIKSVIAWQNAYVMIRFGIYSSPDTHSANTGLPLTDKWSGMLVNAMLQVKEIHDHRTGQIVKDDEYKLLVKDIEYLISEHGYENENQNIKKTFYALYEDTRDPELLKGVIDNYKFETGLNSLRGSNRVDPDYRAFHEIYFRSLTDGYRDIEAPYPGLHRTNSRHKDWEPWLISLTRKIAFIEGRLTRTVIGNSASGENVIRELGAVITQISFTLDERSYWDRAYQLPEDLMPLLYERITRMLVMFSPKDVRLLTGHLQERKATQLGLYTEGYRECLYKIAQVLIEYEYTADEVLSVIEILRAHTLEGVINRWERTPELLRITELLALISATEQAGDSFNDILNTSMGPDWYKDAQFELLNTALHLPLNQNVRSGLFQRAGALLDDASGEMTFQNYIRYDKQSFVGTLVKKGGLKAGIAYYQQELLPEPLVLIANAETLKVDAPRKGDGYHPGARNIAEQGGVLGILKNVPDSSPYVRWALAEVLVINDDTFRYSNTYAQIFAGLLNELESSDQEHLTELYKVIVSLVRTPEMNEPHVSFLAPLGEILSDANFRGLQKAFDDGKVKVRLQRKSSETRAPDERDMALISFNEKCEDGGIVNREGLIAEGLAAFRETRTSVFNEWSATSRSAKKNLKSLFSNSGDVIEKIGSFIGKEEAESWRIATNLLWYLDEKLTEEESAAINNIVLEHFGFIVRPAEGTIRKYSWLMNGEADEENSNVQLLGLLKWFLAYPLQMVRDRAYDALKKLTEREPDLLITELIRETLSETLSFPAEKCAELLADIAEQKPAVLINYFGANPAMLTRLADLNHFSIAKRYLDIGILLNKSGFDDLYGIVKAIFPSQIIVTGEVALEESYLASVRNMIDNLNDLEILNRSFCEKFLNEIYSFCLPAEIDACRSSDRYLIRSFYGNREYTGRFPQILKYAINRAILPRVEYEQISAIYDIIND